MCIIRHLQTTMETYSIYHYKELGLYSEFSPVHQNVVELAIPLVLNAIGNSINGLYTNINIVHLFLTDN